jgi:peptidoglycan/LPS O-acetylase OafA/YrhL
MPIVRGLESVTGWSYVPLLTLSLLVCCVIALVSYRLIESPFLALRKRWSGIPEPERRPILSHA